MKSKADSVLVDTSAAPALLTPVMTGCDGSWDKQSSKETYYALQANRLFLLACLAAVATLLSLLIEAGQADSARQEMARLTWKLDYLAGGGSP